MSLMRIPLAPVFPAVLTLGQSPEAPVNSVVRDSQGAVVPGVEVMALNLSTGQTTKSRTNHTGPYSLRNLRIGSYVLSVEHPGFKKYVQQNLVRSTGQNLELDIALEVGALTDSVMVSASAGPLETDAFRQPAAAKSGSSGVGIPRSDGVINTDLSVLRNFSLGREDRRIQFRGEVFNLANHENFGVPGRVLGSPGLGVVSSAGPPRRVLLGVRHVF